MSNDYHILCEKKEEAIRWLDDLMIKKGLIKISEEPLIYSQSEIENVSTVFLTYLNHVSSFIDTNKNIAAFAEMKESKNTAYIFLSSPFEQREEISEINRIGFNKDIFIIISLPTNNYAFTVSRGITIFNIHIKGGDAFTTLPWYSADLLEVLKEIQKRFKDLWPTHKYYPMTPGSAPPDLLTVFLLGEKFYTLTIRKASYTDFHTNRELDLEITASYTPIISEEEIISEVKKLIDDTMKRMFVSYDLSIKYTQEPIKSNISKDRLELVKEISKNIFGREVYFDWYPHPNPASELYRAGYTEFLIFGPGEFRYPSEWKCEPSDDILLYSKFYDGIVRRRLI